MVSRESKLISKIVALLLLALGLSLLNTVFLIPWSDRMKAAIAIGQTQSSDTAFLLLTLYNNLINHKLLISLLILGIAFFEEIVDIIIEVLEVIFNQIG